MPSTLPDSALVALGICVGLAWDDRDHHPYPGRAFTIADIMAAARFLRINGAASRHIIGAVRHVLAQAQLLAVDDHDVLRLGVPVLRKLLDPDMDLVPSAIHGDRRFGVAYLHRDDEDSLLSPVDADDVAISDAGELALRKLMTCPHGLSARRRRGTAEGSVTGHDPRQVVLEREAVLLRR